MTIQFTFTVSFDKIKQVTKGGRHMDEFKFVFKCLIFSCLIAVFSQTKIHGETLEKKTYTFMKYSQTAQWLRAAAQGGVQLIYQGVQKVQNIASGQKIKFNIDSDSAEASNTPSTGLFRPLNKEKAQQRGITAEPDYKLQNNSDDQF